MIIKDLNFLKILPTKSFFKHKMLKKKFPVYVEYTFTNYLTTERDKKISSVLTSCSLFVKI